MDIKERVEWIKKVVADAHADGIVYGNSGGKDCSLVSILCKMACDNTVGIIMPCESSRNFGIDRDDALTVAAAYNIKNVQIDLTDVKKTFVSVMGDKLTEKGEQREKMAKININPRLRMITLYAYAQSHNMLVAGTGNRSEATMGYFTKWGDGAYDFNPIADLTATEIFAMLKELNCPEQIIKKAPSAGLFEGQTDEQEMGITYAEIDEYILKGTGTPENIEKIQSANKRTEHKRKLGLTFKKVRG